MIITTPNGITINGSKEELAEIVHSIVAGKNSISIPVAKSSKSKKGVTKKVVKHVSKPAFAAGQNLGFDINKVKKHYNNSHLKHTSKTTRKEYYHFRKTGMYSWENVALALAGKVTHTNEEINQIRKQNRFLLRENYGVSNFEKAPRELRLAQDKKYREYSKKFKGNDLHYMIAAYTNNLLTESIKNKNKPKGIGADHVVAAKANGSL